MLTVRFTKDTLVGLLESAAASYQAVMAKWDSYEFKSDIERNYERSQREMYHDRRMMVLAAIGTPAGKFMGILVAPSLLDGGLSTNTADLTIADLEFLGLTAWYFQNDARLVTELETVDGSRDHL